MNASTMNSLHDPSVLELAGPESWHRLRSPSTKRVIRRIAVVDRGMSPEDADDLERRLNRWYFACGCEQGSTAVTITLLTCIASGLISGFDGPLVWWRIVGYLLAAGLAGKVMGLTYAKVRLGRLCRRLDSRYGRIESLDVTT